jgi:hypothetical protein
MVSCARWAKTAAVALSLASGSAVAVLKGGLSVS